jgi:hypothetical protein
MRPLLPRLRRRHSARSATMDVDCLLCATAPTGRLKQNAHLGNGVVVIGVET